MGIHARMLDDQRCVLGSMRLRTVQLETLSGSIEFDQVVFSSVGRDRIKCLRPRPLFQLPIIRIGDCRDSTDIEAKIRLSWKKYIDELQETRRWLANLGSDVRVTDEGTTLGFTIEGENRRTRVSMIDESQVILPSQGPLTGVTIQRAEDRLMKVDPTTRSSVELEIAISTRLEELSRLDRRLSDERRRMSLDEQIDELRTAEGDRPVRLLLVGPRLSRERACIESLRLRGYEVNIAASEQEALNIFDHCSPELVMADTQMGRNEGTDFVLALRKVAGVEEIPVVLVDSTRREFSRDAARRIGAAGYLVYPIDIQRISKRLSDMVHEPRRRRWTRFHRKLPARVEGATQPCMITTVGRGGLFVATEDDLSTHTLRHCRFSLPEVAATVSCEAEVIYRRGSLGRDRGGVGLRFHSFNGADENVLIDYLRTISAPAPAIGI